jgi:hypothetical protein
MLAAAQSTARERSWPSAWAAPPRDLTLTGVEMRPRVAQIAREALADVATIHVADVRTLIRIAAAGADTTSAKPHDARADTWSLSGVATPDVIVLFDVLHLMTAGDQEELVGALVAALPRGGRLLVREADAAGRWRFRFVRLGNWLTALTQRRWRPTFHFRTAEEWQTLLSRKGLHVEILPMGTAAFANVLMVGTKARE